MFVNIIIVALVFAATVTCNYNQNCLIAHLGQKQCLTCNPGFALVNGHCIRLNTPNIQTNNINHQVSHNQLSQNSNSQANSQTSSQTTSSNVHSQATQNNANAVHNANSGYTVTGNNGQTYYTGLIPPHTSNNIYSDGSTGTSGSSTSGASSSSTSAASSNSPSGVHSH